MTIDLEWWNPFSAVDNPGDASANHKFTHERGQRVESGSYVLVVLACCHHHTAVDDLHEARDHSWVMAISAWSLSLFQAESLLNKQRPLSSWKWEVHHFRRFCPYSTLVEIMTALDSCAGAFRLQCSRKLVSTQIKNIVNDTFHQSTCCPDSRDILPFRSICKSAAQWQPPFVCSR